MEALATLILKHPRKPPKKATRTERGDLVDYFLVNLLPEWDKAKYGQLRPGYLRYKLTGVPTKDLYALKSKCEDSKRRGYSFAKTFFYEIKAES